MLKLKPGAVVSRCALKDQKQSHLGGVLPKIQGTIARRKESWAGDLSTTHRKNWELFAIPSLSDLHRSKTSEVVGVFARSLFLGPSTCFIRYLQDYMCKFNLTELSTLVIFSKEIRNIFLLSLLMLARTLLFTNRIIWLLLRYLNLSFHQDLQNDSSMNLSKNHCYCYVKQSCLVLGISSSQNCNSVWSYDRVIYIVRTWLSVANAITTD